MKQTGKIRLGSISLLFAVVLLCVAALAVLAVSTARADEQTSQRYMQHVTQLYKLENEGTQWLAKTRQAIDTYGSAVTAADLPAGTQMTDDCISYTLYMQQRYLYMELRLTDEAPGYCITAWKNTGLTGAEEGLKLWGGN